MKIKGIIFDKDGTLIEFEKTWHKVFRNIFQELEDAYGLSKEEIQRIKELSGFRELGFEKESLIQYAPVEEIILQWMDVIGQPKEKTPRKKAITKDALSMLLERHSKGPDAKVTPLANTVEMIQKLYKKGYILGIATADSKESTLHNLKLLGIESCFKFLGSDDGFFKGKPDPHMGEEFCRKFQLKPKEVLYVGDSITDMLFAENNGFYFVGIKSSHNEYERFTENNYPVIENIGELEESFLTGE